MKLQFRTPEEFLAAKIVVSDVQHFTSSSAPISCYDPVGRRILTPYHASRTGYGEQASVFALSEIPIPDIGAATNYVLLESDVEYQGRKYNWPVDASAIFRNGLARVFFLADGTRYFYFDWSPEKRQMVSGISPVLAQFESNAPEPLTSALFDRYLRAHGCDGYHLAGDVREQVISVAKPAWDGEVFYGALTSSLAQPALFRCTDGQTFELLSIIPALAKYECQIAVLNGMIYALLRGTSRDNFWVAKTGDWQFRPCGRLPLAETRPQLMAYLGRILLAYSQDDVQPNRIRNGRNNVTMLYGEGPDLSQYQEVFHAVDEWGFVYYDIVNCDGELYVIWSNSERFPDKIVRGCLQGKDTLYCSRLTNFTHA